MHRRRMIAALGGGIAASILADRAMADTNFTAYAFPAAGGNTSRTMPDRLADIVNVKDYGAIGNGVADDYPAVQAAFDAAFGSAASPHGSANATLNRPVFFPNGIYNFGSGVPTLTNVVGGHIYGAGSGATSLNRGGTGPVIAINGAVNLLFERFTITGGGLNSPSLDIDWNPATGGSDGLHGNTFRQLSFGNFSVGALVAKTGSDGAGNLFEQVTFSGNSATTGLEIRGTAALNNMTISGGASSCTQGYYCSGGSLHVFEESSAFNTYDLRVDSGFPCSLIGGRSESQGFGTIVRLSSGLVLVKGMLQTDIGGAIANVTGGKIIIDALNSPCVITGSGGSVYLRGCTLSNGSLLSGYSGTVAQNI